jgi:hypothetical protein
MARLLHDVVPTHLLHLAWNATPGVYISSPRERGLVVFESPDGPAVLQDLGGKRMVTAGTCFEYSWEYGYCREQLTPLEPSTLVRYLQACFAVDTVQAVGARLDSAARGAGSSSSTVPHEHPARLVSSVIRALLKGRRGAVFPGNADAGFLARRGRGCGAFVALLDSETVGGSEHRVRVCPVAVKDVVKEIARQLDRQELVKLGALPARPGEPHLLVADTGGLRRRWALRPATAWKTGFVKPSAGGATRLMGTTVNGARVNGQNRNSGGRAGWHQCIVPSGA